MVDEAGRVPAAQRRLRAERRDAAHALVLGRGAQRERPAGAGADHPDPADLVALGEEVDGRALVGEPALDREVALGPPVPRKLNVNTIQPMSRAMRSASSGKVRPEASEPRGGVGKSWHRTTAGTDAVVAGRATWTASASPSTSIRSSTAAPSLPTIILGGVTTSALRAPAFKEWAAVVQALLEGEQILDVRKGGIREDGRHFSVQSTRLWLYPTVEHQQPELLKPAYAHWIDPAGRRRTVPATSRSAGGPTSSVSRRPRSRRCSTRSTGR